ncbi:MAG: hypothetical protein KKD12_01505 [Proteobacteria bacterium]|nr:hypothetical protein [Pseudomonadota bacterium]MCG2686307.1 hypothetical protein [Candidatus Parcubacteria bacterium]
MKKVGRIQCAFCRGSGRHPYYFSTPCTVCKGKGENEVAGEVQTCKHCQGSGRKSGTTLTCFYCGGLGVVARSPSRKASGGVAGRKVDKNTIREVVEETLKKYQLRGLRGVGREEAAVIKRVPVSGVFREEEKMKVFVEPISGVRRESARSIDQSTASLLELREKPTRLLFEQEQKEKRKTFKKGDIKKSADVLARLKRNPVPQGSLDYARD